MKTQGKLLHCVYKILLSLFISRLLHCTVTFSRKEEENQIYHELEMAAQGAGPSPFLYGSEGR